MTEETKQLFGAPWQANIWTVADCHGRTVTISSNEKDAYRLSKLPELYDITQEAIHDLCVTCKRHFCMRCKVNRWKETMKRIRDAK